MSPYSGNRISRRPFQKDITRLISTENTEKLIVDILLVNRDFNADHPEIVQVLLSEYFKTLKHYTENPEQLKKEVAGRYNVTSEQAESMLKGVQWTNLESNARKWFGVAAQGGTSLEDLSETIQSTVQILKDSRDFTKNPLPDGDPYRIINSKFIQELHAGLVKPVRRGEDVRTDRRVARKEIPENDGRGMGRPKGNRNAQDTADHVSERNVVDRARGQNRDRVRHRGPEALSELPGGDEGPYRTARRQKREQKAVAAEGGCGKKVYRGGISYGCKPASGIGMGSDSPLRKKAGRERAGLSIQAAAR